MKSVVQHFQPKTLSAIQVMNRHDFLAANRGMLLGKLSILQGFKYYLCDHSRIGTVLFLPCPWF